MSKIALGMFAVPLAFAILMTLCYAQDIGAGGMALQAYRDTYFDAFESGTRWNYRVWDRNHLIAWTHESSATIPSVAIYDGQGSLVRELTVWLPGSTKVQLNSVAVGPSDLLVIAGAAANADRSVAHFLASIDQSGEIRDIIRTNPFVPLRVCTTDAGDVWSYGWDKQGGAYNMLRRFTFSTGETDSVLNRTLFQRKVQVTSNNIILRCAGAQVFLYMGPMNQLIRFNSLTKELLRWQWKSTPEGADVTGFAVNKVGDIFASFAEHHLPKGTRAGMFVFTPTATGEGHWVPVQGMQLATRGKPVPFDVLGSEGADIVYLATTLPLRPTVQWGRPKAPNLVQRH